MKRISLISIVIIALLITGCNFPGYEEATSSDPDDAMATEIARILTGTPIEVVASPTPIDEDLMPTETPEPLEPTSTPTPEPPEDTPTPTPTDEPTVAPTVSFADTDPALSLGEPDFVESMDGAGLWPSGTDNFLSMKFEGGYMKLTSLSNLTGWRVHWPVLEDFYLEGTFVAPDCDSNDHYGLMFRVPEDSGAGYGYLFNITCDGNYSLRRWNGDTQTMHNLIWWTADNSIRTGDDAVNKLGVMAKDSNLALYINGQKVNELTDNTYLEGKYGVVIGGNDVDNFTAWVDEIRYWVDP